MILNEWIVVTALKYKIIERREIGFVLFIWRNQWPTVDRVDRQQDSAKSWDDKKGTVHTFSQSGHV